MRLLLASVLLVGLSACSADRETPSAEQDQQRSPTPSAPETTPPAPPDRSGTGACAEVRAGIDDFNARDFAGTVDHFRRAVPLARAEARTDPSPAADDLLEAVTYYAELAPADYPRSALSSPEFAKYKAITLGQCSPMGGPPDGGATKPPEVTA